jgi:mRNA interferase MazF
MSKGTLVLTPFPFTNLSGYKIRPALVVHAHQNSEDCIVAFVSSVERKLGLYDIVLAPTNENGLKGESVVKINKLATLEKKAIIGEIGKLDTVTLKKIDEMIRKVFQI